MCSKSFGEHAGGSSRVKRIGQDGVPQNATPRLPLGLNFYLANAYLCSLFMNTRDKLDFFQKRIECIALKFKNVLGKKEYCVKMARKHPNFIEL